MFALILRLVWNLAKIPIKEITIIEDSHTAIARGCLSEAQLIEEEDGEDEEESK